MVKKIAIAIWILTASFLGILVVNYVGNRKMIENYGQGVYQQNELGFLGFTQPYINHFNKGNVFYHKVLGPGIDGRGSPRGPGATRMWTGLS